MKDIGLILPYDYKLLSVASILDVFETVNTLYVSNKKEAPFRIHLFQTNDQLNKSGNKFQQYKIKSIKSNLKMNLVLIPSFTTISLKQSVERNQIFLPWLRSQYKAGAEMASFCTGAFLFAASGLLNGKVATSHVDVCANFVITHPLVFVKPGRTLTVDGRCYTSGGSTSSFHLLVFLIQKYCGHEVAVRISKIFAIELDRHQQSYFSTFRPDHSHHDVMVKRIQKKIEAGYQHISTIEEVIKDLPASRRNLVRRFKQVTGIPPIEYLQNIRVESSKKLLEQTDSTISEIISDTGYTDPKSFRKVFLKLVGITPLEYREKFKVK
jgi:transcriptional regulator GlxA family with amidase domain